jgi:hypothetical protein
MCFSSKVKTPKTDPNSLKAPEPVLIEEPKGVDFGASASDQSTATGVEATIVEKDPATTDKGDGSSSATATDTGTVTTTKKVKSPSVKRAITKVTA